MKLTAKQLWSGRGALTVLAQRQMPSRVAYEVSRIVKLTGPELDSISEQAKALVDRHGGTIAKTGLVDWTEAPGGEDAFNKAFDDVLQAELEVNAQSIRLHQLEHIDFPPALFLDLDWMITDEPKTEDGKR